MPLVSTAVVGATQRPNYDAFDVTPSDSVDLPAANNQRCVGLRVTGAGNVNVQLRGGGTAVLTGLSAGQILDIAVTRVLATSTTATGIQALYHPTTL